LPAIFKGVLPFMWADVVRLAILIAFPSLSLWLPSLMK
jgi:C4-dicarboxylate transporter, DctM subunit